MTFLFGVAAVVCFFGCCLLGLLLWESEQRNKALANNAAEVAMLHKKLSLDTVELMGELDMARNEMEYLKRSIVYADLSTPVDKV